MPPTSSSRLTVVIPVYNRPETLRSAVDSVLAQGIEGAEILIVDDASTEPLDLGRVPGLRVVRHERNRGAAAARNTGIAQASGSLIAFLDSDDIWQSGKLAGQLALIETAGDAVAGVFTPFAHAHAPQKVYNAALAPADWFEHMLKGCRVAPGSTLVMRRNVARNAGPQDETLKRYEDWDWLLRVAHCYEFAHASGPGALLGASGRPALKAVEDSLHMLHERWRTELKPAQLRRFEAALAVEQAAARRWHRNYAGFAAALGKATLLSPATVASNIAWSLRLSGK